MDNEIPLPPQPRVRHRSPAKPGAGSTSSSLRNTYRFSRVTDDRSSLPSSDPALFSSDDIPASGLENYTTGTGRKRRYRGTWWGETLMDPKRKRADFKEKRNVDSGVWMGSDESSFLPSDNAPAWGEDLLKNIGETAGTTTTTIAQQGGLSSDNDFKSTVATRATFKKAEEPREHRLARAIVNECLEKGQDSVDLSNGLLRSIPPGLLQPLQLLTKLPAITEAPITEDGYSSLEPFLRLFLSGNALTVLPGEIFELATLKVLSLRNNKLTSIPTAVRKLTMLQEINLSMNRLECLPWEFLWLIRKGDLKHMIVHPNPLLQIGDAEIAVWHYPRPENDDLLRLAEYEGPAPEESWAPIHIATGPVKRFNMEGFPVLNRQNQSRYLQSTTTEPINSRVPSLREVSLLAFSRSPYVDQISDAEMPLYFPELMARLLRQAKQVKNAGGRSCSVCHRSFVLPRTEWVEWWDCSTYENGLKRPRASREVLRPLPFQRFGCSWACSPSSVSSIPL
ncbi:hypothetical protein ASPZODRAFT_12197 [Penicilliopsis zonata CBS 506.65]|uniref:Uncharacterized protein n=1 Tax=Penicilliopsis zonata CBS 506.65 TaxID=1073090 RepID=A0A1L9SVX6_9EURO|nr:hypothetical protein ASPZODRAFT_12197 [Penicilliopsis zonata CBS 506.65]OJJ51365.1 hypothetical protein ASPZODRAFT_12197 [Penicilliopsis zonata CBS 506.65]